MLPPDAVTNLFLTAHSSPAVPSTFQPCYRRSYADDSKHRFALNDDDENCLDLVQLLLWTCILYDRDNDSDNESRIHFLSVMTATMTVTVTVARALTLTLAPTLTVALIAFPSLTVILKEIF